MEYATSRNKSDCVKLSVRNQIAASGHHLELVLLSSVRFNSLTTGIGKEICRLRMILKEQKWELRNLHEEDRENFRAY